MKKLSRDVRIFLSGVNYARCRIACDSGERWITVNSGSRKDGTGGGSHVLIDGEGRVVSGMGGRYKGVRVDDIPRKKFIHEAAYQRRQEAAKAAGASAESGLYHKGADGSEFYRYGGSPAGTAWRRKVDEALTDVRYPAEREDYNTARREAEQHAQQANREAIRQSPEVLTREDIAGYLGALELRHWESGDGSRERYYLSNGKRGDHQISELFGLEVDRYNSGNIRKASLNGETISNPEADRLMRSLRDDVYYDASTGAWHGLPAGVNPRATGTPDPALAAARAERVANARAEVERVAGAPAKPDASKPVAEQLSILGLNRWQKGEHDRFYMGREGSAVKAEQMAKVLGLEIEHKDGEVVKATKDGVELADNHLRALNKAIRNDRTYYDNTIREWSGLPTGLRPVWPAIDATTPTPSTPAKSSTTPTPPTTPTPSTPAKPAPHQAEPWTNEALNEFRSQLFNNPVKPPVEFDTPQELHAAAERIKADLYRTPLPDGHVYLRTPELVSKETDRAVFAPFLDSGQCDLRGDPVDGVWLPKSHVTVKNKLIVGVSPWIASKKGLCPLGYSNLAGLHPLRPEFRSADIVHTYRALAEGWDYVNNHAPDGVDIELWAEEDRRRKAKQ